MVGVVVVVVGVVVVTVGVVVLVVDVDELAQVVVCVCPFVSVIVIVVGAPDPPVALVVAIGPSGPVLADTIALIRDRRYGESCNVPTAPLWILTFVTAPLLRFAVPMWSTPAASAPPANDAKRMTPAAIQPAFCLIRCSTVCLASRLVGWWSLMRRPS